MCPIFLSVHKYYISWMHDEGRTNSVQLAMNYYPHLEWRIRALADIFFYYFLMECAQQHKAVNEHLKKSFLEFCCFWFCTIPAVIVLEAFNFSCDTQHKVTFDALLSKHRSLMLIPKYNLTSEGSRARAVTCFRGANALYHESKLTVECVKSSLLPLKSAQVTHLVFVEQHLTHPLTQPWRLSFIMFAPPKGRMLSFCPDFDWQGGYEQW